MDQCSPLTTRPLSPHTTMALRIAFSSLIFLLSLSFVASIVRSDNYECVYTVYVRTGSIFKGGTDSKIGLKLYDSNGYGIHIRDLQTWGGLMGADYNYFERGNLDIFSGRGPCLDTPICAANVTSDGTGAHHGWYCNYVEVTSTGPHMSCYQKQFTVEQWLALEAAPYQLWAASNNCSKSNKRDRDRATPVDGFRSRLTIQRPTLTTV